MNKKEIISKLLSTKNYVEWNLVCDEVFAYYGKQPGWWQKDIIDAGIQRAAMHGSGQITQQLNRTGNEKSSP